VVQVDELFRFGDVKDNVEFANRFLFRSLKCGRRRPEAPALGGIFCPLVFACQIFKFLGVLN
jgi:hypothetical protein